MKPRRSVYLSGPVAVLWAAGLCLAQAPAPVAPPSAEGIEFFEKKIRPLLSEHCYQCHSASAAKGIKGGLTLDHRDGTLRGGDARSMRS